MAWVMNGLMMDQGEVRSADYKGSVVIEWNAGNKGTGAKNTVIPAVFTRVLDMDGELIPALSVTVHAKCGALITADVAVFLDDHGEILYDLRKIADTNAVPATFPFLVAGFKVVLWTRLDG